MEETILQIKFKNKNPVELNQFTLFLNALSRHYKSFLKQNYPSNYGQKTKYLCKVEPKSITIELANTSDTNKIIEFYNYIKLSLQYFLGKKKAVYKYSNQELHNFHSFLNLVANNQGSVMTLQLKNKKVDDSFLVFDNNS